MMYKKIFILLVLLFSIMFLSACQKTETIVPVHAYHGRGKLNNERAIILNDYDHFLSLVDEASFTEIDDTTFTADHTIILVSITVSSGYLVFDVKHITSRAGVLKILVEPTHYQPFSQMFSTFSLAIELNKLQIEDIDVEIFIDSTKYPNLEQAIQG